MQACRAGIREFFQHSRIPLRSIRATGLSISQVILIIVAHTLPAFQRLIQPG
jgi:hypothetical protein